MMNIENMTICLGLDSLSCGEKNYCLSEGSSNCKLLLPYKHLISGHDNNIIYLSRMADELVRYGRIRDFIFKPRNFISFQKINYNLNYDEIILLDNLLDEGYFDDLVPIYTNPFLKTKKTFDTAQPNKHEPYTNRVNFKKEIDSEIKGTCLSKKYIKGNVWKEIFQKEFETLVFANIPICTWKFIAYIIHNFLQKNIEISDLKEILIQEYNKVGDNNMIYTILEGQGKKKIIKSVKKGRFTFENQIMSEDYYITNLDLFMFIKKYKIPTVFISGTPLKETGAMNRKKIISFLYGSSQCFVIRVPAPILNHPNEFSILSQKNKILFSIFELPKTFQTMIFELDVNYSFQDYYNHFTAKKYKVVGKKKIILS